jgi:hypothetical protein
MAQSETKSGGSFGRKASALVVCGKEPAAEDRKLIRLLEFLGISWRLLELHSASLPDERGYAVIGSAASLAAALQGSEDSSDLQPEWLAKAASVYVCGFGPDEQSTRLLRLLSGAPGATLKPISSSEANIAISTGLPEICGPMSGMRMRVKLNGPVCVCEGLGEAGRSIVRLDDGDLFFEVDRSGLKFYLNTCGTIIDIDAPATQSFDIKQQFCEAAPPVLYLKSILREPACDPIRTNACLIVDDPPLRRRYGFLNFRDAIDLMDRHRFAMTVAFIPWNWRRNDRDTVELVKSRPDRFSVVVHGCDHTRKEFAERSPAVLGGKLQTAIQRMESFRRRTALGAELIMVFPQGEFSPEAGRALKLNGYIAAVNTEVAPSDRAANKTTIADLWSVAIMRYGSFPIFTRRYPHQGLENFAFDALLGKPCLIAAHHDTFRDQGRNLAEFVDQLNSLNWNLEWQPLAKVLRRSFEARRLPDGVSTVRMFSCELVVPSDATGHQDVLVLKEESDPDKVEAVLVDGEPVAHDCGEGLIRVRLRVSGSHRPTVRIAYSGTPQAPRKERPRVRLKVAANRYLSEFRDNYLSRSDRVLRGAIRIKRYVLS